MKHGLLLIDKPAGLSSHAVVARARRAFGTQHVGHAGTLDPMATGVLVLALGEGRKVLRYLTLDDKRYAATVRLGVETDTLDADGVATAECAVPHDLRADQVQALLAERFLGERLQRAPAVSAIKRGGVALHQRVRRGEVVVAPERLVTLYACQVQALRAAEIDLELHCGKGFYVRALARDLAEALGTLGHLTRLRRLASGRYGLAQAVPFDQLAAAAGGDAGALPALERAVIPIESVLADCRIALTARGAEHARHGRLVPLSDLGDPDDAAARPDEPLLLCDPSGALIAIARRTDSGLEIVRGFRF